MEKVMEMDWVFDIPAISSAVTVTRNLVNDSMLFLADG